MKWLCTGDSWKEQCYLLKVVDDHMRLLSTEGSWLEQYYLLKIADDHDLRWLSTEITDLNSAVYWW